MHAGEIERRDELCEAVKAWLVTTGTQLVTDTGKDSALIQALIDLHASLEKIVADAFAGDTAFSKVCSCLSARCFSLLLCRVWMAPRCLHHRNVVVHAARCSPCVPCLPRVAQSIASGGGHRWLPQVVATGGCHRWWPATMTAARHERSAASRA